MGVAFICLLVGHLVLKTLVPSVAVNVLGLMLLGVILFHILHNRRDVFGFILITFICSHFGYADNQGGVFNLLAFALLSFYLLRFNIHETGKQDLTLKILLWVLIVSNVLGWIMVNPEPVGSRLLGAMSFCGYLLMFYVASNIALTKIRLGQLLTIIGVVVAYNFIRVSESPLFYSKGGNTAAGPVSRFILCHE